jgi:hypothetical protein
MDQPTLDNKTEFEAHQQMLLDIDGEKLLTVVKASFELRRGASELAIAPQERNRPIRPADIPWGEPEVSSIGYPSDLCLRKPGTDVVVVGKGYAPHAKAVPSFDVGVAVGSLSKTLRVFGPRVWTGTGNGMTEPAPISELELRYEYAWGGYDDSEPENIVEEGRNPIGRGKVRDLAARTGSVAPQIEDPGHLIGLFETEPAPAGVGAIGRHWLPRRRCAGSYDETWLETRAPLPPMDLDDRFFQVASPGLNAATPLQGGEQVKLYNLLPNGRGAEFTLPKIEVTIAFHVHGRETVSFQPHLDTVLLDLLETSDEKPPAVELVWRAAIPAPRRMGDAKIIVRERDLP